LPLSFSCIWSRLWKSLKKQLGSIFLLCLQSPNGKIGLLFARGEEWMCKRITNMSQHNNAFSLLTIPTYNLITDDQRITSPSSFSIPWTKSKISLPPSIPPRSPVARFSSAQISWNLMLQSLVATTKQPSSSVLLHQTPPSLLLGRG
jgi:hypothetical protein